MTAKTTPPSVPATPRTRGEPQIGPRHPSTLTAAERLQRIEVVGQRINGYIQFICQVGTLGGSSDEAKEKAVAAFYDLLVVLERGLGRIQEDLRLG